MSRLAGLPGPRCTDTSRYDANALVAHRPFKSATRWRAGGSTHEAVYETALTLPTGTFSLEATRIPEGDSHRETGGVTVRVDADAPPAVLQIYATEKPQ